MTSSTAAVGHLLLASLSFPSAVHSIDALQRAAYRFCDRMSVDIDPSDTELKCTFNFLKPQTESDARRLINDFKIEVLDQELRARIAGETSATRNAILALAFSKAGLQAQ